MAAALPTTTTTVPIIFLAAATGTTFVLIDSCFLGRLHGPAANSVARFLTVLRGAVFLFVLSSGKRWERKNDPDSTSDAPTMVRQLDKEEVRERQTATSLSHSLAGRTFGSDSQSYPPLRSPLRNPKDSLTSTSLCRYTATATCVQHTR